MRTCTGEITLTPIAGPATGKMRSLLLSVATVALASGTVLWATDALTSAAAGAATAAVSAPASTAFGATVEYADFAARASHNGRYRAAVVDTRAAPGVSDAQLWTVSISRQDNQRVEHARVAARAWMPETGELSPVQPAVRNIGGGRYVIGDVTFSRAGWWNVALVIDGAAGTDSLAFNVRLR